MQRLPTIQTLRFGIELETIGLHRAALARAIHGVVGGAVCEVGDRYSITAPDGRRWQVVPDGSLSGGYRSGEIVSPILGYADLEVLQSIVRAVRAAGAKTDPSTGIHIHVGSSSTRSGSPRTGSPATAAPSSRPSSRGSKRLGPATSRPSRPPGTAGSARSPSATTRAATTASTSTASSSAARSSSATSTAPHRSCHPGQQRTAGGARARRGRGLGTDDFGEHACTITSLIASAKLHDLDPEAYLRDVLRVLPHWPTIRMIELAPKNWRTTRERLDAQQLEQPLGQLDIPAAQ